MDFAYSPRVLSCASRLWRLHEHARPPAEERYFAEFSAATVPHHISPVMEDLKAEARRAASGTSSSPTSVSAPA